MWPFGKTSGTLRAIAAGVSFARTAPMILLLRTAAGNPILLVLAVQGKCK